LADLTRRGARVAADSGHLIVDAPRGTLTDADRALIRQYKPDLLKLVGYASRGRVEPGVACGAGLWRRYADVPLCRGCADSRGALVLAYWDALSELYGLNAEDVDADLGACRNAVDRAARLTDDLGADLAIRIRERWSHVKGSCPLCGGSAH